MLPTAALPGNEEDRRSGELRDGGGGTEGMLREGEGLRRCRLQGEQHTAQPALQFHFGKTSSLALRSSTLFFVKLSGRILT